MNILIPGLLLGIYSMLFFFYLGMRRRKAVSTRAVDHKYYRTFSGGEEPEALRVLSRHGANQFEMPMLFYAVLLMIYVTDNATPLFVGLAWAFLVLRFAHAFVHLGTNFVPHRFLVFAAGVLVLLAMWVGLLVKLLV